MSDNICFFVYGTLKRGEKNHHLCQGASAIKPAFTWGRLYDLPEGYPALELPKSALYTAGTGDPQQDSQALKIKTPTYLEQPSGDWDQIHGELVYFDNANLALPNLDALEEFTPRGDGLYQRNIILVQSESEIIPAWVYWMKKSPSKTRVYSGNWSGCIPYKIKP